MNNKHIALNIKNLSLAALAAKRISKNVSQLLKTIATGYEGAQHVAENSLNRLFQDTLFDSEQPNKYGQSILNQIYQEGSPSLAVRVLISAMKQAIYANEYTKVFNFVAELSEKKQLATLKVLATFTDQTKGRPLLDDQPDKYLPDAIIFLSYIDVKTAYQLSTSIKLHLHPNRYQLLTDSMKNKYITDLDENITNYLESIKTPAP